MHIKPKKLNEIHFILGGFMLLQISTASFLFDYQLFFQIGIACVGLMLSLLLLATFLPQTTLTVKQKNQFIKLFLLIEYVANYFIALFLLYELIDFIVSFRNESLALNLPTFLLFVFFVFYARRFVSRSIHSGHAQYQLELNPLELNDSTLQFSNFQAGYARIGITFITSGIWVVFIAVQPQYLLWKMCAYWIGYETLSAALSPKSDVSNSI